MSDNPWLDPEKYWVSLALAAKIVHRTYPTVRSWTHRGRLKCRRHPRTGTLQVWLWDVYAVSDETHRRNRNP